MYQPAQVKSAEPFNSFFSSVRYVKTVAELHQYMGLQMQSDYWGTGEKGNWTFIKQKGAKPTLTENTTLSKGKKS